MARIVILTDHSGYYEPDEPLPQSLATAVQAEFRRGYWPPLRGMTIMGRPVEIEDRRPPQPTVSRIEIDLGGTPPPPPERD